MGAAAAVLPLGMAFLMAVLGMGLAAGRIGATLRHPVALALGLAAQVLGLPLIAAGVIWAAGLTGPMALGVMLVAASPGGITSNYITHLLRGDVALSVAMTLCTTLMVPLSLPLILSAWGAELPGGSAGLLPLGVKMAAVTVVPLVLGMGVRRLAPGLVARGLAGLERLAKGVFAAIVVLTFWQNAGALRDGISALVPLLVALNLSALALGAAVPRLARLAPAQARAITVELGMQNVAVTIFAASSLFAQPSLAVPGLIYAALMNLSALAMIGWQSWRGLGRGRAADVAKGGR